MNLDTRKKRAAAFHWGRYRGLPSVISDGFISMTDRAQIFWGYPLRAEGFMMVFGVIMGSGVDASTDIKGVMFDEQGNARVSNKVIEGRILPGD